MDNNDLLRRLRYALRCDDAETSRLIKLGGGQTTTVQAARLRVKETDPDFTPCSTDVVAHFLDGLIFDYRGPREEKASSPWPDRAKTKKTASNAETSASKSTEKEPPADKTVGISQMDNNVVLKQLRIALSLRSDDVHAILQAGGSALSASEAGALFRNTNARNFRKCGDQVLRQFIAGLVERREQASDKKKQ